jgi:ribokinase
LVSTEISAAAVAAAVEEAITAPVMCILNPAPVLPIVAELLPLGPIVTPNESELVDLLALLGDMALDRSTPTPR